MLYEVKEWESYCDDSVIVWLKIANNHWKHTSLSYNNWLDANINQTIEN